jgi:1-acyl-sn-glycerol-3-phosphate acyltransferase
METTVTARCVRALGLLGQLLLMLVGAVVVAPRLSPGRRGELGARLAARTLRTLHVRVRRLGATPYDGPMLLVANHVSWLDVYALNALVGGPRSVAKSEVARWPIAGAIARGFGTFFHVRGSYRDAARVKNAVAVALRAGERVLVFPEGTTTEGGCVGRFHAALFQAAVDAGMPVQPVAIHYPMADGSPDPAASFVGEMTFVESLVRVLRRRRLEARVTFGPVLSSAGRTRRQLAALSHAFVTLALECARHAEPTLEPARPRLARAA